MVITGKGYIVVREWRHGDAVDSFVMSCPHCEILISIKVQDCAEGREFLCSICGKTICINYTPEELEKMIAMAKQNQERALKRSFPLTFGDV